MANNNWMQVPPSDWQIAKIGSLFSQRNEKVSDRDYAPLSVSKGGIVPQMEGVAKTDANDNRKLVIKDDFVINSRSDRKQSCGVSPLDGSVSLINIVLSFSHNELYPAYVNYLLKNYGFAEEFYRWGHGIVADLWTTRWSEMKNILIPLPSLDEQKRIADFLDDRIRKIDALIENENKQIEGLESYKRAIISSAVTKGLHSDVAMDSVESPWISQIPQGWSLRRTKYIATSIEKGSGITRDDVDTDGDIKCVRYGEIYFQYDREITKCVSSTFLAKAPSPRFISKGDVLCAGTGELVEEIGKNVVYMCDEKCLAGGDIIIVHHHEDPVYLNYALNSSFAQNQKSYGKAKLKVVHISANEIGNVVLPLPPIETQKEIASYLDRKCEAMDTIVKDKRTKIDELKSLKSSLIYEFVTGKRRLPS